MFVDPVKILPYPNALYKVLCQHPAQSGVFTCKVDGATLQVVYDAQQHEQKYCVMYGHHETRTWTLHGVLSYEPKLYQPKYMVQLLGWLLYASGRIPRAYYHDTAPINMPIVLGVYDDPLYYYRLFLAVHTACLVLGIPYIDLPALYLCDGHELRYTSHCYYVPYNAVWAVSGDAVIHESMLRDFLYGRRIAYTGGCAVYESTYRDVWTRVLRCFNVQRCEYNAIYRVLLEGQL